MTGVILRFDDISVNSNHQLYMDLLAVFLRLKVVAIWGVVPFNSDKNITYRKANHASFIDLLNKLREGGQFIVQHGVHHSISELNGLRGEFFASKAEEEMKLLKGKNFLKSLGIECQGYMPPAHGASPWLLDSMKSVGYDLLTDGYYLRCVIREGVRRIPQQIWRPRVIPGLVLGSCVHFEIDSIDVPWFDEFCAKNHSYILNPFDLKYEQEGKLDVLIALGFKFLLWLKRLR